MTFSAPEPAASDLTKRKTIHEDSRHHVLPSSPEAIGGIKLRNNRPKSMMAPGQLSTQGGNELSNAFKRLSVRKENSVDSVSPETTVDVTPKIPSQESLFKPKKATNDETAKNKSFVKPESKKSPVGSPASPPATIANPFSYALKKEPMKKTQDPEQVANKPGLKPAVSRDKPQFLKEKPKDIKQEDNAVTITINTAEDLPKMEEKSSVLRKFENISKPQDSESQKLPSPRLEYRLKRAARSKTLPEQPVSREILDKQLADSAKPSETNILENTNNQKVDSIDKKVSSEPKRLSLKDTTSDQVTTPASRSIEPKRLSLKDTTNSNEAPWLALAKKRQTESGTSQKENNTKQGPVSPTIGDKKPISGFANDKLVSQTTTDSSFIKSDIPKTNQDSSFIKSDLSRSIGNTSSLGITTSLRSRDSINTKSDLSKSVDSSKGLFSSKDEKDITNISKKMPEVPASKPVERSLSSRTKAFEAKPADKVFASSIGKPTPYNAGTRPFSTVASGFKPPTTTQSVDTTKSVTTGFKPPATTSSEETTRSATLDRNSRPATTVQRKTSNPTFTPISKVTPTSDVPLWKQNLQKKKAGENNIDIEIIPKPDLTPKPASIPTPAKTSKFEEVSFYSCIPSCSLSIVQY